MSLTPARLTLTGGNGDALVLSGFEAGIEVLDTLGIFSRPPSSPNLREGPGDGAALGSIRTPARPVTLQLLVDGNGSLAAKSAILARLADVLDDAYYGPARLTVAAPFRSADEARFIDLVYTGGWDGTDSGRAEQVIPLAFTAPEPFFRRVKPVTLTWTTPPDVKPFLQSGTSGHTSAYGSGLYGSGPYSASSPSTVEGAFFPVELGSSTVLGTVTLDNPGDVAAFPVWRVVGPGGPVVCSIGGEGWTIDEPLGAFDVLFVNGQNGTVTDGADVNRYDVLGDAPKLQTMIPPRAATAQVEVTNATPETSVLLEFYPRYKVGA